MKSSELTNEIDRKHAEREERRKRVKTYKDKTFRYKEKEYVPENRRIRS